MTVKMRKRQHKKCLGSNKKLFCYSKISVQPFIQLIFPSILPLFYHFKTKLMSPHASIQCFYDIEPTHCIHDEASQGYPDSYIATSTVENIWSGGYVVLIQSKVKLASKGTVSGKGTRKCTLAPTARSPTATSIVRPRLSISCVVERRPTFSRVSVFPSWHSVPTDK